MPAAPQVRTTISGAAPENSYSPGVANRQGISAIVDWYTYMALCGAAYQVRAGTITTPLIGSVAITDTQAELAIDAATAVNTVIPVYANISMRLMTGTLHEYALKSVATVSSAGAAFIPLPLRSNMPACLTTARVAAHAVTVTAELATTTLRHWSYSNPAAGATGALPTSGHGLEWIPRVPPVLVGPRCFYLQMAATGTGPSYYASVDFIEALTASLL